MRADGALSAEVRAAVDRAGCVKNETKYAYVPALEAAEAERLSWSHLATAAATLLVTLGGMGWLGHTRWSRQRLLVRYAGGETFYEETLVAASAADARGGRGDDRGGAGGSAAAETLASLPLLRGFDTL